MIESSRVAVSSWCATIKKLPEWDQSRARFPHFTVHTWSKWGGDSHIFSVLESMDARAEKESRERQSERFEHRVEIRSVVLCVELR